MTDMIEIGILGASGRMGREVLKALDAEPRAKLTVALAAPNAAELGQDVGQLAGLRDIGVRLTSQTRDGLEACDVMIDFSSPQAAIDAALAMHESRCHTLVTGTTGFTSVEEQALISASDNITLLKSGNFSLGVNMLEILVEQATRALNQGWDVEILDMHHKHKVDAPSGTASHEVRIASELEMITLSHDALDRSVFASGAVAAALWAAGQPKGLYDMKDVLGLGRSTPR